MTVRTMKPWKRALLSTRNQVKYLFRRCFRLSLGEVRLKPGANDGLFTDPKTREREEQLLEHYHFDRWKHKLGRVDYQLNLYHLDLMDSVRHRLISLGVHPVRLVDVGSRTFYYAPCLYHFGTYGGLELKSICGIELDPYRRYRNGYTAYDYALAYMKEIGDPVVRYEAMDFAAYEQSYNVCTMFLPFVTEQALLHWGLPLRTFMPQRLIEHAYEHLASPGVLLITNKGPEEQRALHELLDDMGIPYESRDAFASPFDPYDVPRYVTIVTK
ncbi:hypothetical protein FHS18_005786 [Paenibacillus phyllosphaerae]|uniref:Uncharacterized protein n=1 Tax=Paenibacillus phyllosphaerae TaxID=274593 RepID=A0A7W5B3B8_9BACL|nr:hypothetical protein [Paenibacillus phyllosphaerae]MBB3113673.1 hypothetical protein [Paenibacillus phyllosphaerae]